MSFKWGKEDAPDWRCRTQPAAGGSVDLTGWSDRPSSTGLCWGRRRRAGKCRVKSLWGNRHQATAGHAQTAPVEMVWKNIFTVFLPTHSIIIPFLKNMPLKLVLTNYPKVCEETARTSHISLRKIKKIPYFTYISFICQKVLQCFIFLRHNPFQSYIYKQDAEETRLRTKSLGCNHMQPAHTYAFKKYTVFFPILRFTEQTFIICSI